MVRHDRHLGSELFLVLTSLLIAFVIWMIAKRDDSTLLTFTVPLRLKNVPENVMVRTENNKVNITLPIPNRLRLRIKGQNPLQAELDFKELPDPREWCGTEDYRPAPKVTLDSDNLRAYSDNQDFQQRLQRQLPYALIDSTDLAIQGKLITRPAMLVFPMRGQIPPGFRLAEPPRLSDGRTILLTASERTFEKNTGSQEGSVEVQTEPINLENQTATFSQKLELRIPADMELVYSEDRRIEVILQIEEITAIVEGVQIRVPQALTSLTLQLAPQTANVEVRGPENLLQTLEPGDLVVEPDRTIEPKAGPEVNVGLRARLRSSIPKEAREALAILGVSPDTLVLRYTQPPEPKENTSEPEPEPTAQPIL